MWARLSVPATTAEPDPTIAITATITTAATTRFRVSKLLIVTMNTLGASHKA